MQALRTKALAVLMAVLVVVPLGSLGPAQYLCRMMGRIVDTTCCCGPRHGTSSDLGDRATAEVEPRGCCQLLERTAREGAPALREGLQQVPDRALVAVVLGTIDVPRPAAHRISATPAQARAPPRSGPPIFLKNCSLLT